MNKYQQNGNFITMVKYREKAILSLLDRIGI